jgi:hypothetical protein
MSKGAPDPQHELVVTALSRCLKLAYPEAALSQGSLVPDLNLKPDIHVTHLDGRRWVYEVVNKNVSIPKIEANHQVYAQAGVQDYWILWETHDPGKPIDDSTLAQSMWLTDEMQAGPGSYPLSALHRALVSLGEGTLYVLTINKPLQKTVEHWAAKLAMIWLQIYHFPPEEWSQDRTKGDLDVVPLPVLSFNQDGKPMLRPGADALPTYLEPLAELPSDAPIFITDIFGQLDQLSDTPDKIFAAWQESVAALQESHGEMALPQTQAFMQAAKNVLELHKEIQARPTDLETDAIKYFEALENLIAILPEPVRSEFQKIMPVNVDTMRQMFELRRWFEQDPHLQALLDQI